MNFWEKLEKPFLCLAPMEDVTDTVFRQMVAKVARPDVFFTEFTNVEGIVHGGPPVLQRLCFSEEERPIVAQIWGKEPENFLKAAKLIVDLGFDGIDINMGCPQRDVIQKGCCIALVNNRSLASEIIKATKKGAGKLPVSVKTRIGLDKIITEDWCGFLLEQKLDALTAHGRTAKEMSAVPAHWDEIAKVVRLRDQMFGGSNLQSRVLDSRKLGPAARARFASSAPLVIGNGDVKNFLDAKDKLQIANVDGVMIGRGILENIAAFSAGRKVLSAQERVELLREHLRLWEKTWGTIKNFSVMKKYFKIYIRDFDGAGELRAKLMETDSIDMAEEILRKFLN